MADLPEIPKGPEFLRAGTPGDPFSQAWGFHVHSAGRIVECCHLVLSHAVLVLSLQGPPGLPGLPGPPGARGPRVSERTLSLGALVGLYPVALQVPALLLLPRSGGGLGALGRGCYVDDMAWNGAPCSLSVTQWASPFVACGGRGILKPTLPKRIDFCVCSRKKLAWDHMSTASLPFSPRPSRVADRGNQMGRPPRGQGV